MPVLVRLNRLNRGVILKFAFRPMTVVATSWELRQDTRITERYYEEIVSELAKRAPFLLH